MEAHALPLEPLKPPTAPEHPKLPQRKHPAHLSNRTRHNQPIIIFLTVATRNRQPLLANPAMVRLLAQAWSLARFWMVGRYIVMPDHVHLFCSPATHDVENIRDWSAYWKGLMSRGLQGFGPLAASEAAAIDARSFPVSVNNPGAIGADESIWQRDVWDTQMRSADHYAEKWAYVRHNPVRKGLVGDPDEWPYQGELNALGW